MYGLEHKAVAIACTGLILLQLVFVRHHTRTFFSPACIFAAAWFCFTFFPLILLFSTPINSLAILYIACCVLAFSLSAAPFDWKRAAQKNEAKLSSPEILSRPTLIFILYVSAIASGIFSLGLLVKNGFTLDQVFLELLATSGQFAAQRGTEQTEYGLLGVLGTFFTYLAPVLGGLQASGKKRAYYFLVAIIPCTLAMLTQSSKIVFLVGLCLYGAAASIAMIYANRLRTPVPRIGWGTVAGVALIPIAVLVSFISRLGVTDFAGISQAIDPLKFSINSYTVGQIYAFSDFFSFTINAPADSVYKDDYYSLGAFTFASIFDMMGIGKEFPPGMYYETAWHASTFETNIFTVFRGLIYDFGIAGSLVFIFFFGLLSHAITYRILSKRKAWFACAAYVAIIVFILMGYLFSVFVARYIFLNMVAVFAILFVSDRYETWKRTRPNKQTAAPLMEAI